MFRVTRQKDDLWIVHRPGGVLPHGFPTPRAAISFARDEICRSHAPAWIEVRIGDMDFGGYFDPKAPRTIFGIG